MTAPRTASPPPASGPGSTSAQARRPDAATASVRPVLLLVCGEPTRGDDAAGPIAVEGLPPELLALVEVRRTGGLDVDALLLAPPGVAVVLVDAAVGIRPGQVVVLPFAALRSAAEGRSEAHHGAPRSSHELPVDQVVGLAAMLRGDLPDGSFVGIGAASSRIGRPLSAEVAAALPAFRATIEAEVRRLAAPRP